MDGRDRCGVGAGERLVGGPACERAGSPRRRRRGRGTAPRGGAASGAGVPPENATRASWRAWRMRVFSSSVAAFVNVTTSSRERSVARPSSTRRRTRPASANVLPVPALASTSVTPGRRARRGRRAAGCGGRLLMRPGAREGWGARGRAPTGRSRRRRGGSRLRKQSCDVRVLARRPWAKAFSKAPAACPSATASGCPTGLAGRRRCEAYSKSGGGARGCGASRGGASSRWRSRAPGRARSGRRGRCLRGAWAAQRPAPSARRARWRIQASTSGRALSFTFAHRRRRLTVAGDVGEAGCERGRVSSGPRGRAGRRRGARRGGRRGAAMAARRRSNQAIAEGAGREGAGSAEVAGQRVVVGGHGGDRRGSAP